MIIGIAVIVSILCIIIAGLFIYLYFKSDKDKKEYQHESEMKELEVLFDKHKTESETIIRDYEIYITNFQAYYHNITEIIRMSDQKLQEIDVKGSFKADDEIGFFFKSVKELQDILNGFDFSKPFIKKEEVQEYKPDPISPDGKSNVIVISQEQAEKIVSQIKK